MAHNQRASRKPEPEGEWVVFHERPFPHRLSRGFNIAGGIVGVLVACGSVIAKLDASLSTGDPPLAVVVGISVIAGAIAFGVVYTIRCFAVVAYGLTRKKQYVVDWEPTDPSIQGNRRTAWFFAALFCLCAFFYYLRHYA